MQVEIQIFAKKVDRKEMIAYLRKNNRYFFLVNFSFFTTDEIKKIYLSMKKRRKKTYAEFSAI